jgi:hypothetical protein
MCRKMNLFARVVSRRRRKAHERYLRERDRQRALGAQDAQEAVRDISVRAAGNQQGGSFQ